MFHSQQHLKHYSDFVIVAASAVSMTALTLFIKYTRMGKAMRATAQNQKMAMLLGIDVDRIISASFILGSALAALGGVLIASHVGVVNFSVGFLAGIKAFTAAVLGGIGSIPGAILLLDQFKYYANNPRKQLDKYLAEGKKTVVGIFFYYAPEEIAHASGLVPFGV